MNADYARTVQLLLAVAPALLLRGGVGVHSASLVGMVRRRSRSMNRYRLSTFSRTQGVLCRTLRLDPMLGLVLKHRTEMRWARTSPPWYSTISVRSLATMKFPSICQNARGCSAFEVPLNS